MQHIMRKTVKRTMNPTTCYPCLALLLLLTMPYLLHAAPMAATPDVMKNASDTSHKKASASASAVVNLNQASAEQLASQLKGIGYKRAQAIVHYRETHGPFASIEQLVEVPGISSSVLEQNRQRLTL